MKLSDFTDAEQLAVRESPRVWFDAFAYVEDREKKLRKADESNRIQERLFSAYEWCRRENVPCRIIGLKSRKEGLSTGATALAYHHLREHVAEAVVIGTDNDTSDTLMRMFRRYVENDAFPWGGAFRFNNTENKGAFTHGSEIKRDTAIDPKAGRSSTIQVVIGTEVGHWPTDGKRSADETMLSILNSMPDIPNILCVIDSTANGAGGFFYDTYQSAVTLEERKRGVIGNGWIRMFEPWHASPLRAEPVASSEERDALMSSLSQRETQGRTLYGWTPEQIKWRRSTIAVKCNGDETKFDQEYPDSELVAYQSSGKPRFSIEGMTRLDAAAKLDTAQRVGRLDEIGAIKNLVFTPDATPEGWLWVREKPTAGRSYVAFLDPCLREQANGAKESDSHAFGVLRRGYTENRVSYPDELVAAIHVEGGCRWDSDQIAQKAYRVCEWYGGCMIVPEVNVALDVLKELRELGANIYAREEPADHISPGQRQRIIGWKTTNVTRPLLISAVAEAIRENTLACLYKPLLAELRTFVVDERGRAAAMGGKHDDWCIGLGLGLHNIECASMMPARIENGGHFYQPARAIQQTTGAMS